VAYTEDSALAGVIMAARNQSQAVVACVGVVPEQRGAARHRRAEQIGGDGDLDTVAMVKAFVSF
jgi:hypothetical protein